MTEVCKQGEKWKKEEVIFLPYLFFNDQDSSLRFFLPLVLLQPRSSPTIKTGCNFKALHSPSGKFYLLLSFILYLFLLYLSSLVFSTYDRELGILASNFTRLSD